MLLSAARVAVARVLLYFYQARRVHVVDSLVCLSTLVPRVVKYKAGGYLDSAICFHGRPVVRSCPRSGKGLGTCSRAGRGGPVNDVFFQTS